MNDVEPNGRFENLEIGSEQKGRLGLREEKQWEEIDLGQQGINGR